MFDNKRKIFDEYAEMYNMFVENLSEDKIKSLNNLLEKHQQLANSFTDSFTDTNINIHKNVVNY